MIYNIEEGNGKGMGVLTFGGCCQFEVLMTIDRLPSKTEENLPHNHVSSTRVVKLKEPDWLQMKCPDVGMKCKQSHVVKHSIDHEKCSVHHHKK